jgi:hypothetical protein
MLKLKANPTFRAKVKITTPGETTPLAVEFEFKHFTRKAYAEWLTGEASKERTYTDAVLDVAVGWFEVDAEFNRESVEEFLQNYHAAGLAIVETHAQALTGARLGN